MNNTELAKGIHWVGAVDWDVRDFHGYSTLRGTTYNAFLIVDEKVTLFDTVKRSHLDDLIRHVSAIIDPKKIDYLVVNHVEMDHSGSLPEIMELIQPEKLICSPMGHKAILDHFHREDWPFEIVKSGTEISLGKRTIQFLETRMLHWPDSMFSYIKEDGILFSSDAFGQHYATSERFDDEVPLPEVMQESAKYYANILYLFSPLVKKLLKSVSEMNLDIKMIAPDHGVIWRTHHKEIFEAYEKWSAGESSDKALVIYETMWQSTAKMAKAIAAGLEEEGISTELINLKFHHRSDILTKVLNAKAVIVGSPTLNNGLLPEMAGFLMYMRGLKPLNKIGASFGSFGWSGESVKLLNTALEEMKIELVEEGMKHKYVPNAEVLQECNTMGHRIGETIKAASTKAL
ncbi:FprA family A-type flavoprotein [Desulfosediminicola flagellatus]|uniref:FprA family A-type flavoprotein n=1 Tax=Desulfosediminicola flagellatus TaxID=2569541 RepID=UPI0010AD74FD|nr:flavodoxin domain-containing protein [Desulfosediminicola flagellatus]